MEIIATQTAGFTPRLRSRPPNAPFIKRQKNDAADAEAIVEAALRPTMRFVEPKSTDQQARTVALRTRERLVKQRTETVNALRSHLYEFGHVAAEGIGYVPRLGTGSSKTPIRTCANSLGAFVECCSTRSRT